MIGLTSGLQARSQGALLIVVLLIGTAVAWYALGAIRWDIFLRKPEARDARLLRLLLAMVIAGGLAGFVLQYASGAAQMHG